MSELGANGMPTTNLSTADKAEISRRFSQVDTSNVADVLDQIELPFQGLHADFRPYPEQAGRLAGWAYTIRGQMVPYSGTGDAAKMEACHGIGKGEVSIWSGDGSGICYFGELIALGMMERGSTGALVDGGIRDVRWLGEHKFPVYARYRTPVQSIGRWRVTGCQESIYLRGATSAVVAVNPGDFILGDEDGVIVIPANVVEKVLVEAERLTALEVTIRKELRNGMSLESALKQYGHV
jgi:4-hydroxy-4-methyl-2-oxoglutarate aldolase